MAVIICFSCNNIVDLDWNVEYAAVDEKTNKWYCINCIEEAGMCVNDDGYIVKCEDKIKRS